MFHRSTYKRRRTPRSIPLEAPRYGSRLGYDILYTVWRRVFARCHTCTYSLLRVFVCELLICPLDGQRTSDISRGALLPVMYTRCRYPRLSASLASPSVLSQNLLA